ncbi:hypothetical protein SC936_02740 [Aggregatibacter actinomycetemcomitans serotype e str. SC936]|nr:hypothetical protein SA3096_08605 [Aggregatibacter actinomycetemcomitans serotype e str. SA3096]KYK81924.1 hypothetical protein SC936_02740 [Aggregatibacter actinomycetemcomitans serotype e str. SC936]
MKFTLNAVKVRSEKRMFLGKRILCKKTAYRLFL